MDLFDRDATLTIGTIRIPIRDSYGNPVPQLRISFKAQLSIQKTPDTAEVTIYNLTKEHRAELQKKKVYCDLQAGYVGATSRIIQGDLLFSQSVQNGTDWITTLHTGDGVEALKSGRINTSLKGPVTPEQALNAAAKALGLPLGNIPQKASGAQERGSLSEFVNGLVLSGKGERQLEKVCRALGLRWYVQQGTLHVVGASDVLGSKRPLLRPGSGLIGSPQAGEDGIVKARALIMPDLLPGYGVRIESAQVDGDFRIEKTTFIGDTFGTDWYADLECRQVAG